MTSANYRSNRKFTSYTIVAMILLAMLSGCKSSSLTRLEYAPQMYRSPAYKAQQYDPTSPSLSKMRMPPYGTVPINFDPYRLNLTDTLLQDQMQNPLPRTEQVLKIGQKYFNIYCIVCHGPKGDGMGYIVPKGMQMPPSYLTGQTLHWSDGRIFYLMTRGRGNMSSYAAQLTPDQRWAVVHYIRTLQRAGNPTTADLQRYRTSGIGFENDVPDTSLTGPWPKQ